MSDEAYPKEWGLADFPHPNPYFPPVPRTGKRSLPLPVVGKYMLIVGGLGFLTGILMLIVIGRQTINAAPILGGLSCALIGYVLLRLQTNNEIWNSGRIVPAIVIREGEGPGMEDAVLGIAGKAVGLGSVAAAAGGSARPSTLEYVSGGQIKHAYFTGYYGSGMILWIILYQGSHALPAWAPPPFDTEAPPPDVQAWLNDALENARLAAAPVTKAEQPPW